MTLNRAAASLLLGLFAACALAPVKSAPGPRGRCGPADACWPKSDDWKRFASMLDGRLEEPRSPWEPCRSDAASEACRAAREKASNPFALEDDPGATQSTGWLDAWQSEPSAYAVVAESARDLQTAVRFAHEHRLRLAIKGTGHDYLGRSSAPGSLLVWTHHLRRVTVQDSFVPQGCSSAGVPAVTVEAGARWLEVYQEVTGKHGRYVQGGGCTSVGAAGGFMQGGGFGSWSNKFGTGAAGMLEAQVVTADGTLRVANACQNPDLFWALRGGGGGTYGVVTQVTLMTHPAPASLGFVVGKLTATSDEAFHELLLRLVRLYRQQLANENWGEQVKVRGNNTLDVSMSFVMTADEARAVWEPFLASLRTQPNRFGGELRYLALPGNKMWNAQYIQEHAGGVITPDPRPNQPGNLFWWTSNQSELETFWYSYQSRWLPRALFEPDSEQQLATALFEGSRHFPLEIHFNKGQAAASADALRRDRETSMNPAVYRAAALVIAADGTDAVPGVGQGIDRAEAIDGKARVTRAMNPLRALTADAGTYVNETDYFEPDWQRAFWGENYARLIELKRKYDPDSLFTCHHCVGSEESR